MEKITVLIVDDEEVWRGKLVGITSKLLQEAGVDTEILVAVDATEAIWKIENGLRPTAVITDYAMPAVFGLEFIHFLREEGPEELRNIPIVLVTGDKNDSVRQKALEAGCSFVLKPDVGDGLKEFLIERMV